MKTQRSHKERQHLHSWELMKYRENLKEKKIEKKWKYIGYIVPMIWGCITLGCYIFMG